MRAPHRRVEHPQLEEGVERLVPGGTSAGDRLGTGGEKWIEDRSTMASTTCAGVKYDPVSCRRGSATKRIRSSSTSIRKASNRS